MKEKCPVTSALLNDTHYTLARKEPTSILIDGDYLNKNQHAEGNIINRLNRIHFGRPTDKLCCIELRERHIKKTAHLLRVSHKISEHYTKCH